MEGERQEHDAKDVNLERKVFDMIYIQDRNLRSMGYFAAKEVVFVGV